MLPTSADSHWKRLSSVLRWLPLLVPPVIIFIWMRSCLVNVPFMDDYVWLPFYKKFHDGTWRWGDLMFVQMEHRLTVPAFLTCIFYHLAPGRITLQNWASFVQLCLTGLNLLFILRRTLPELKARWLAGFVLMLALFSPTQASTLLWADCFSSYMAPFFLTTTIALFISRVRFPVKLALCVVLGVLSSVSYGSGILVWGLMVPLILWSDGFSGRRQRVIFLIVWLLAALVTMKLYFVNLVNQAQPEFSYNQQKEQTFGVHLKAFLESPWQSLRFMLMFAGSMLGRGTFGPMLEGAFFTGALLALALGAACVVVFIGRDRVRLRAQLLPWIMIGAYAFAMAGMVAMSRMEDSRDIGALWNRYTIHTVFAVIPLVVFGFAWFTSLTEAAAARGWRSALVQAGPLILGLFTMHLVAGWIYGAGMFEAWWSSRLRDATCQLFGNAVPRAAIQGPLTLRHGFNWDFPVGMDEIKLLDPPMAADNRLDHFRSGPRVRDSVARLKTVEALAPGNFSASGMAFVHGQSRPADGVLLCYKDEQAVWRIFCVGQVLQLPVFLRDALNADMQYLHAPGSGRRQTFYGEFEINFAAGALPAGVHEIAAWTFDFPTRTASRMGGLFRIDVDKKAVEAIEDPDGKKKQ